MSGNGRTVTCSWCHASCRDNGRGQPVTHFPGHVVQHDPTTGVPLYCPGGWD